MELEFKGTKGKWFVSKRYSTITDYQGLGIAQEHGISHTKEWEYNAKLIAASPDLLEALQNIVEQVEGCELDFSQIEAVKLAKAAINKALK